MTGLFTPALLKGERRWWRCLFSFHNIIIGNFMVCKDRFETNLLQLFAHPQPSEWFSIICAIIFEVNVVAAQKQA